MQVSTTFRLLIYFLLAAGTQFASSSEGVVPSQMDTFQWIRLTVEVLVAGLITVKAYVDVTYANAVYDQKKKNKQNEILNPVPPIT